MTGLQSVRVLFGRPGLAARHVQLRKEEVPTAAEERGLDRVCCAVEVLHEEKICNDLGRTRDWPSSRHALHTVMRSRASSRTGCRSPLWQHGIRALPISDAKGSPVEDHLGVSPRSLRRNCRSSHLRHQAALFARLPRYHQIARVPPKAPNHRTNITATCPGDLPLPADTGEPNVHRVTAQCDVVSF